MKALQERLRARRLAEPADDLRRYRKRMVPLIAFYGGKPEREAARNEMYAECRRVFTDLTEVQCNTPGGDILQTGRVTPGYDGRWEIAAIERNRLIAINLSASPFEWLASHNLLERKIDAAGIGNVRFSAGLKLRDLMIGAEPSGLKSFNLEGSSGGGGVPMMISDFKLDCLRLLTRVSDDMKAKAPKRVFYKNFGEIDGKPFLVPQFEYKDLREEPFRLLQRVIYHDEWVFDGRERHQQRAILDQLHWALDSAALTFGMISPREFDGRWSPQPQRGPQAQPSAAPRSDDGRHQPPPSSEATIPEAR